MKTQILTLVITSLIILNGCNENKSTPIQTSALPKVSNESKAFAQSITRGVSLLTLAQGLSTTSHSTDNDKKYTKIKGETNTIPCLDGGEIQINYTENNASNTVVLNTVHNNCIEGTRSTNGEVKMTLTGTFYPENISFTYISDLIFEDTEDSTEVTITKDSAYVIKISQQGQNIVTTESMGVNFKQNSNEEVYKSTNLTTHVKVTQKGEEFYFVSGKKSINNELYTVDTRYVANATPMTLSENGNLLKGGKMKFINAQNHRLTLEAIAKNKIEVSVDLDNDGQIDQSEVLELE